MKPATHKLVLARTHARTQTQTTFKGIHRPPSDFR